MANAATPTIVPKTGNSADREKMSVQSIGFPPTENAMSADTLAKTALPVLARVPRLEVGKEVRAAEEFVAETPVPSETRQYRFDSSPTPSIQSHRPVEQIPSEAAPQIQENVELLAEEFLAESEAPPIVTSTVGSSPLRTLQQRELTSTEDRISAYLLRLQVMLKPLARIILLAALLTASALAYLLLEDNHVPLAPLKQQMVPTPNRPSEPRLTRRPTSAEANSKPDARPTLNPSRPLSATGPAGNRVAANKVAAIKVVPTSPESLPKPPSIATNRVPSKSQVATKTNVPASYPNTGHPDVTPLEKMSLPIAATKAAPPAKQTIKQDEQPPAVAKLTGSIQTPIKR